MTVSPTPMPFGERLAGLLAEVRPERTQVWLANAAGVTPATISRLLAGKRMPDVVTLQALAPVFGLDPSTLVRGTDAENRVAEAAEWVSTKTYQTALENMRELEAQVSTLHVERRRRKEELEIEKRDRKKAEDALTSHLRALSDLQRELELKTHDNAILTDNARDQRGEIARQRRALDIAVAKIDELTAAMKRLEKQVDQQGRNSLVTKILAGVAAATGVVTVATLMNAAGNNENDEAAGDGDDDDE